MDSVEFRKLVEKAIDMYMPVIKKVSVDYITRQVDDDCVSTIVENLYREIRKFKIY